MKTQIMQPALLDALQQVARAAPTFSPIPVLSSILLRMSRDRLALSASNSVLTIRAEVPAADRAVRTDSGEADSPDRQRGIVVPARYLLEMVRKLPACLVELELPNEAAALLTVRAGSSLFRLRGLEPDAFPDITPIEAAKWSLTLPNGLLRPMIRGVVFAAAASEMRPLLCGVLCRYDGHSLRFVATDSVRFASRSSHLLCAQGSAPFETVIPAKGLSELARLLQDEQGETVIAADESHIRFQTSLLTLQISLLHGTYPPIEGLVPSRFMAEVTTPTAGFLQAIERVTLLAGETSIVHLRVGTDRTAELLSASAEIGDVREDLPVSCLHGDSVVISFNGKYMADIVRTIDAPDVLLRFSGIRTPITVQPADPELSSVYLLTPIRTAAQPFD
ncbi:DNA polymerase III subunit beta [Paenibacillus ginsengarvi]|nr:DNA polymerase III subunit beta [Paenibacillus ginsengarvi]